MILHPNQPVTVKGDLPSPVLIQIIQMLEGRVAALEAHIRGIPEPVGGVTVDTEARAAINALRAL